jgi:hypothetical protein
MLPNEMVLAPLQKLKIKYELWRKPSWIVKRYGKYRRNQSWIVKWYGKYERKASQIMKRFGKYSRTLWKYMKNMENMEEKYFFLTKQLILPVIYLSLRYALQ